jgi:hypothetical protein
MPGSGHWSGPQKWYFQGRCKSLDGIQKWFSKNGAKSLDGIVGIGGMPGERGIGRTFALALFCASAKVAIIVLISIS